MVETRLFVEGGGDGKALRIECRRGFHEFLRKAGLAGRMPRIVACGGRTQAYDSFCFEHANARTGQRIMLLVDSETSVTADCPWKHLLEREEDAWQRPAGASDDQCHLMVQCMEAWFLSDRDALREFFKQGFHEKALPGNTKVETVRKEDVYASLQNATQHCKTKAPYGKGEHSFKLLAIVSAENVMAASPWAKRFVDALMSS